MNIGVVCRCWCEWSSSWSVEGYDLIGQGRTVVFAWWTNLIGEKIYPGWIPFFMTSLVPSKICHLLMTPVMLSCWSAPWYLVESLHHYRQMPTARSMGSTPRKTPHSLNLNMASVMSVETMGTFIVLHRIIAKVDYTRWHRLQKLEGLHWQSSCLYFLVSFSFQDWNVYIQQKSSFRRRFISVDIEEIKRTLIMLCLWICRTVSVGCNILK